MTPDIVPTDETPGLTAMARPVGGQPPTGTNLAMLAVVAGAFVGLLLVRRHRARRAPGV